MALDIGIQIGLLGVAQYNRDLSQVDKKTDRVLGGMEKSVGRVQSNWSRMVNDVPLLGNALSLLQNPIALVAAGITAISVALGSALNTAADFQQQLANVGAIQGVDNTTAQFQALSDEAKRLGSTTEFTATQAGQAMEFLARAGFDATQTLKGTEQTLSLATVGALDLGRAADIATDTLQQFSLPVEDLGRVVDVIAKTTVTANTNVTQFADAMNYLGATANALGIPIEEASAAIGVLSSAGLKGSLATRALGTALLRVTKPSREAQGIIEELGLEFFDAQGNFVGLAGTIETLEKGLDGLSSKERQRALATIFGAEAIQEFNILLDKGSDELRSYTAELEEAGKQGGAFARGIAEAKLDTFQGAVQILRSALEGLGITLTSGILGPLQSVTESFTEGVQAVTLYLDSVGGISGAIKENAEFLILGATALAAYNASTIASIGSTAGLIIAEKAKAVATSASAVIQGLVTRAQALYIISTNALTGSISLATAAQRAFNVVFGTNPLGAAILAVGALAAGLVVLNRQLNKNTESYEQMVDARNQIVSSYTKERKELDSLFAPLKSDTATREDKVKAIDEINDRYRYYLPNLLSEKSTVEEIRAAYDALNKSIIEGIVRRAQADAAQPILDEITKKQLEINDLQSGRAQAGLLARLRSVSNQMEGIDRSANEIQAGFASIELSNLRQDLARLPDRFIGVSDQITEVLGGLDLSKILGIDKVKKDTKDLIPTVPNAINSIAEKLKKLGVDLGAIEELDQLNQALKATQTQISETGELELSGLGESIDRAKVSLIELGSDANDTYNTLVDRLNELGELNEQGFDSPKAFQQVIAKGVELEGLILKLQDQGLSLDFEPEGFLQAIRAGQDLREEIQAVQARVFDLGNTSSAPLDTLETKFQNVEKAIRLISPDSSALPVLIQQSEKLSAAIDAARVRIVALRNGIEFDPNNIAPVKIDIDDSAFKEFRPPELAPVIQEVDIRVPDLNVSAFESVSQAALRLGVSQQFANQQFRDSDELIRAMSSGVFELSQRFTQTNTEALQLAIELQKIGEIIQDGFVNAIGRGFEALGKGFADAITGAGSFGGAFLAMLDAVATALLVEVPRMIGFGLIKASLPALPASLPLFLAGIGLVGFSGFASGLLSKLRESQNEDLDLGGIDPSGIGSGSTANAIDPTITTANQQATQQVTTVGLGSINVEPVIQANFSVFLGPDEIIDQIVTRIDQRSELTG